MKKQSDLSRLMGYAGNYRYFTYASWVLSAVSALVALVPFVYIWKILQDVLNAAPDYAQAVNIPHYGWMAVLFAVLSYLIYIAALLCSHLSAFRVATNLRLAVSEHLAVLPLGFAETFGSGKLRKIIHESTGAAETYLAHQLPDQYNAIATPVGLLVLLLAFDWRLGLLSLAPVVLAALKAAQCMDIVEKFPAGIHTVIGIKGVYLSGGERQRISIARAFLKDAPIILLDEATASLDVENETAIQGALSRLIKNKTVLIIAHRMRTVAGADQVVVLSGGIVAEQGSPAELYALKGLYAHMVNLQSASQNWTI